MKAIFTFAKILQKHIFLYLIALIFVTIVISSFLILKFEAPYSGSSIKAFGDALWWSAVGVSTIGIGNVVPESQAGRYLTLFLMVIGVIIFSVITAKIASIFTEEEVREDLNKELDVLEGDLNKVERDIESEVQTDDKKVEVEIKMMEKRLSEMEKNTKSKK